MIEEIKQAIVHFEQKIAEQGIITNARDEEHLLKLKNLLNEMQYINKNTGTLGANLDYQGSGKWSLFIMEDNRYRVLTQGDDIKALDINLMAGMVEVGKKLPGYNREVASITKCDGNEYEVKCFGW